MATRVGLTPGLPIEGSACPGAEVCSGPLGTEHALPVRNGGRRSWARQRIDERPPSTFPVARHGLTVQVEPAEIPATKSEWTPASRSATNTPAE